MVFPTLLKARQILERPNSAGFTPEVETRIRAAFDDLVAGDLLPPDGWGD